MINNYLDWVKSRRKWYVQSAVRHEREFRDAGDDWTLGFNKGLAMAYDCAGLDFKRLQKDIEARIAHGRRIVIMPAHRDGYDEILS